MAGGFKIETPKGAVFTTTGKNGKIIARLEWNKNFSAERSDQFNQTQRFVDSEVLRLSSPMFLFRLVCWINLAYWEPMLAPVKSITSPLRRRSVLQDFGQPSL